MSGKRTVQTIADVARLANVSKSTVSRALSDSPLIGSETKERIRAIAATHNFQINAPARRLSLKKSRTIAFVIHCAHKEFSVADLFGLEIMGGITRALYARGYDMLQVHVDPHDTGWARHYLDSGRVDGFILMTYLHKQSHIQALLDIGAPFILWGISPNNRYCTVSGDNFTGGKLAAEHLIHSGRQRIAFLGGPANENEIQERFSGYEEALHAAGRSVDQALLAYGDYSIPSGSAAMQRLLDQAPDLDAVFVNSDLMAIAAINTLREGGRRVPEDIAVVGYDDLSVAEIYNPALTTIRQNVPLAGKLLAENLIQNLQTGVVTNVTLPVELVVRKSA